MIDLKTYIGQFAKLTRAPGPMWTELTRSRAPHKPILLLAVLDLVARGSIASPFIDVTGDLIELNELFNLYWRRIVPAGQTSSIAFPFSRLHNEPFWKLVPILQKDISRTAINSISSVSQLRAVAVGAQLDADLLFYMKQLDSRSALRETLFRSCFSAQARVALDEQTAINDEAYHYSVELEHQAHLPLVSETLEALKYRPDARCQGFRRIVVTTYDHRCAMCGVRVITTEGHTAVDAAHIIPWSESRNDDVRNGMALCKLCHWAFDEGMMGVSESYAVITSPRITANHNVPGLLLMLSDRKIISPKDQDLWPAQQYLEHHRKKWRL